MMQVKLEWRQRRGKEGGDSSNDQEKDDNINSTNNVNTASDRNNTNNVNAVSSTDAAGTKVNAVDPKTSIELPNDPNMPELGDIVYSDDDEDVGAEADMNNLNIFMHNGIGVNASDLKLMLLGINLLPLGKVNAAKLTAAGEMKTVNGEVQLQALVDGKKIIVTEASIRHDLQLNDVEGTDCLPNAMIFEELTRMRY
ncbi:hypothetical protein Tco_1260196 [Tanacetum coccineum]